MKKILLIIAVVSFAFAVNAQTVTNENDSTIKKVCCKNGKMTNSTCNHANVNNCDAKTCNGICKNTKCTGACKDANGICTGKCKNGEGCKGNGKSCKGTCKKVKTTKKS